MKQQRNVDGLRQNAQRKRQEAIERTEQGIKQLLKEGRVINFRTVAEVADVSTAWLYKQPEIKAQIEHLRRQRSKKEKVPIYQKASDASKDALVRTLKEKLKKLEAENRGLRQHIEVVQGIALQVPERNRQISMLISENSKLKKQLNNTDESLAVGHLAAQEPYSLNLNENNSSTNSQIQSELNKLNIKINSTLSKLIETAPKEVVIKAIGALKEALAAKNVHNPCGFLVEAIKNAWMPSEAHEQKIEFDTFKQWYPLAITVGLVKAATKFDGVQHVFTTEDDWIPFKEMLIKYPLKDFSKNYT